MKTEQVITKTKKKILQVYHNSYIYLKDMKSYADRKEFSSWNSEVISRSGYLNEEKLIVPQSCHSPDIHRCNLIILNDLNNERHQYFGKPKPVQFFDLAIAKKKFEIFKLKKEADHIAIYLDYGLFDIGEPVRDNFKLCNLEMNVPVEVKINGKLDHSMSSGAERSFRERCYIFHLIGESREFEYLPEPFDERIKEIPKPQKVVDLMKTLY